MSTKLHEREFMIECIHLYRNLPALWNTRSKEYYDRKKKNSAYAVMLSKYREMFPEATRDSVKKKFNVLRTNYRKEMKKQLQSKNEFGDYAYEPTLWYYDEMSFLQEQNGSDTQSNVDIKIEDGIINDGRYDNNYTEDDSSSAEYSQASYLIPQKKSRWIDEDSPETSCKRFKDEPSEYRNWGLACAEDLKKMELTQQIYAKRAIAEIIMHGQLGNLQQDSVEINKNSSP